MISFAQMNSFGRMVGIVLSLTFIIFAPPMKAQNTPCTFIDSALTFAGSPQEQAKCLLRPVKMYGELSAPLKSLPAPLDKIIGQPIKIEKAALQRYLSTRNIKEAEIGGSLSEPLSQVDNAGAGAVYANYFVIHDVSAPNYLDAPFPPNIKDQTWEWNDLQQKWLNLTVAHVFINRLGESVAAVEFKSPLPKGRFGTKFARDRLKENAKGLQLHVELVQPRRRDPKGGPKNDAIAPVPGFTEAQMDRLALVYAAASVRRGQWLIPAYHAALDAGIKDAHDDPQNFDLKQWADSLGRLLKQLASESHKD